MVLDPTATSVQANVRTERPAAPAGADDAGRLKSTRQETGQTSRTSPDVVRISAAALEAARAVRQPAQPADQGAAEETVRESERRESPARQQQELRTRTEQQRKPIDLMA
ncbi:MAG: hypothetical protein ACOY3Z_00495 [Thermodesulfobacteriota bacterium]